jgi:hypothetical protein
MKKVMLASLALAGAFAIGTLSVVMASSNANILNGDGDPDYSISFNSESNVFTTSTSEATASVTTSSGNPIGMSYSGYASQDGLWGVLSGTSKLANTTAISGIRKISFTLSEPAEIKVSYGWSASRFEKEDQAVTIATANEPFSYSFNDSQPSFFSLGNTDVTIKISSLVLTYTCSATDDPFLTKGTALPTNGKNDVVVADAGNWYAFADGKSKISSARITTEGLLNVSVSAVDTANSKYAYLRYQPVGTVGTVYNVSYKVVTYLGNATISIGGGSDVTYTDTTTESTMTYTSKSTAAFGVKIKSAGEYTFKFTFTAN